MGCNCKEISTVYNVNVIAIENSLMAKVGLTEVLNMSFDQCDWILNLVESGGSVMIYSGDALSSAKISKSLLKYGIQSRVKKSQTIGKI